MKRLGVVGAALALLATGSMALAETPDEALAKLKEGNERYVAGKNIHLKVSTERRYSMAETPFTPLAAILDCSDSRVPPDIVMDTGWRLYVVRVAGNVCDVSQTGSLEFAVTEMHAPLIVVLGHTPCPAISAAIANKPLDAATAKIIAKIAPAINEAKETNASSLEAQRVVSQHNVYQSISDLLQQSQPIRTAIREGKLKVIAGLREARSGRIDWLGEYPFQPDILKANNP